MSAHSLLVSKPLRPVLMLAGGVFFVIGAVGVVVPLLPTTPFMLLAIWCFGRSSRKFHDWLYQHPVFGPPVQDWEQHGVIARKAKILAISMMIASFLYMLFLTSIPLPGLIGAGAVLALVAIFIGSRPEHRD